MNEHVFDKQTPAISLDTLRIPQYEAYNKVMAYYSEDEADREIGIVIPVGCGKSGLITLLPFAVRSRKALVIAPNLRISKQLTDDFDMSNDKMFYTKCSILSSDPFPESVEIRGTTVNRADLDVADVVITNIQQLQGDNNRWLQEFPADYFDLIIFDEAHHNVASSWENLRTKFPTAKIVNLSATPTRSDGKIMSGNIIYSYPICDAIQNGYVKRLKAVVLNPATLKYVREEDGREIEVTLDEVVRLGEDDSDFRRSIVTSKETLATIVDASIRELYKIRERTGNDRHKIIASALNYGHCIQVKSAYAARGLQADFVHSREESVANEKVMKRLENDELDVIVQVRKLGEGFDHPYLSVAAVFSIFSNLSPFVQFVGRIMRVVEQNNPQSVQNQGSVIFHAGANIARQWEDFQAFSQADQEYFDQLLPIEGLSFNDSSELEIIPERGAKRDNPVNVVAQKDVTLRVIPLLEDDEARKMFEGLVEKGVSPEDYKKAYETLQSIRVSKVRTRQADRKQLDELIKNAVGKLLRDKGTNPEGMTLDKRHIQNNFVYLKASFDKEINNIVGAKTGVRNEMTQEQLSLAIESITPVSNKLERECFNG